MERRELPGDRPALSVIVPMFNEEAVIESFFGAVLPVLDALALSYEIICVNDGSVDRTLDMLIEMQSGLPALRVIDLSRNFGKEIALTAGLEASRGCGVIPMDADLQDPPSLIPVLVERWLEGYDVVYAKRARRDDDSFGRRLVARSFYRIYNRMAEVQLPARGGDYRLMDRRVVDALGRLPEVNRFMKGLFAWVGFSQIGVPYVREGRVSGESKWNYWKLWNFALDAITSFSTVPLRVWTYFGFIVSLLAFVYAAFLILRVLVVGVDVPGYASLMVVVLFLGGIQLTTLGIIGEYLGRVFVESKRRPLYLINRTWGFEGSTVKAADDGT